MPRSIDEGGGASKSTDPAAGTSQSTDVSLREFLTQEIQNSRAECKAGIERVEAMIAAANKNADENVKKALDSIDRRFDSVNEFRGALSDLSAKMASKDDITNLSDKFSAADEALEVRFEQLYQRNRDDITKINERLNLREGQESGSRLTKGSLYASIGAAVAIIGLLVVLANYLSTH
jgi:hypothetical protein